MNPRIFGAFLVGAGLIAVAYYLAPVTTPTEATDASVAVVSGPAPTREYIHIGDSDNDGVPDWREEFRVAEPVRISNASSSAGVYTPPDTLTGQLAIDLFQETVRAQERGPFGQSQEEILRDAAYRIEEAASDEQYTEADIGISSETDTEALRAYGNRVAEIILVHATPENARQPYKILEHALRTENEEVLRELDPWLEIYTAIHDALLEMQVPDTVAQEHLNLLNAYNAMRINIEAMRDAHADPFYTMVRIKRYQDDSDGLVNTAGLLFLALDAQGITWTADDIVSQLLEIER